MVYIRDVQEPILVLVLLVNAAHEGSGRRQDLIDEDENCLLGRELDTLADDIDKLSYGKVGRDEVLLLVDGCDVRLLYFLANNLTGAATSVHRKSCGPKSRCR